MDDFIKELLVLLKKHNATILRSASKKGELVVSIPTGPRVEDFQELAFEEEISEYTITTKGGHHEQNLT